MRKLIITGTAIAMLALPAASMASQPTNPGAFGKERSSNIATYFTNDGLGNWGQWTDGAAARAGDNSQNTQWMQDHNQLPVESNAGL
jgi:hypothetical protein